jgi:2-polyprenyl-6-methoxyphenol hydroxylase-like FAD-dependent oxidoreductase
MFFQAKKVGIIGAGPVGLSLFRFLEKFGHKPAIFDRIAEYSTLPKAHYIQHRSLEIFEELGLADTIYETMPERRLWENFVYCQHVDGKVYRIQKNLEGPRWEAVCANTGARSANLAQNLLVPILHHEAVQFDHELTDISQNEGSVRVKFANGKEETFDYVVGCDGAHSLVRKALGIDLIGRPKLFDLINICFRSKSLAEGMTPAMLTLIYNAKLMGILVFHYEDLFVL